MNKLKLHLGCGLNTPMGWIHLDGSQNARLAKYPVVRKALEYLSILPKSQTTIPWSPDILIHDLRKPLPFEDDSLSAIYSSHTLEHLYLEQAKCLLQECFRVLEPGSVLRMVVPDLRAILLEYMGESSFGDAVGKAEVIKRHSVCRADRVNQRLLLRSPEPASGIFSKIHTTLNDFHSHKWMYDAESLCMYFKRAGFAEVQEMACHQSRIEGIEEIEVPGRVLNGAGICVEGVKQDSF